MIHLHVHSSHSYKDGIINFDELGYYCKHNNQEAVALTDHGTMAGCIEFYNAMRRQGVKPIIGYEAYCGPQKSHLILLAKDNIGYTNLLKICSLENSNGDNYLDLEEVANQRLGYHVVCLTACLSGETARLLNGYSISRKSLGTTFVAHPSYSLAKNFVTSLKNVFEEVYLELQVNTMEIQERINRNLILLARDTNLPLVLTADAHYLYKDDAQIHNIVRNFNNYVNMNNPDKEPQLGSLKGFDGEATYYLMEEEEIAKFCEDRGYPPDIIKTTNLLAESLNVYLTDDDSAYYGQVPFPELTYRDLAGTSEALLAEIAYNNMALYYEKYLIHSGIPFAQYERRITEELNVVEYVDIADYLLMLYKFVTGCKRKGIPIGLGRGSSAGSVICFALGITNIDPVKYELRFDRFLNTERFAMPDIDTDVSTIHRAEAIELFKEYGTDKAAQIANVTRYTIKTITEDILAAIKKRDRKPTFFKLFDEIKETVTGHKKEYFSNEDNDVQNEDEEEELEFNISLLYDAYYKKDEFIAKYKERGKRISEKAAKFFHLLKAERIDIELFCKTVKHMEGLARNASTHAGGVALCAKELSYYAPLTKRNSKSEENTNLVLKQLQFDKRVVEAVRILKVDVLGLTSLDIIHATVEHIKQNIDPNFDLNTIPFNDEATFEMLRNGYTRGVFQMNGSARKYAKELFDFNGLCVLNALNRPGPLNARNKEGKNIPEQFFDSYRTGEVKTLNDRLDGFLDDTYGHIIYQEQCLDLVKNLVGCSNSYADKVRKALGHKDMALMELLQQELLYGLRKYDKDKYGKEVYNRNNPYILGSNDQPINKGALANGFPQEQAEYIVNTIVEFAKYAFNKSHSAAYALTAYQTAYLKCHYPISFFLALLNVNSLLNSHEKNTNVKIKNKSYKNNNDDIVKKSVLKVVKDREEFIKMGYELYEGDINKSDYIFIEENGNIRTGLILYMNSKLASTIIEERNKNGLFTSVANFCDRMKVYTKTNKNGNKVKMFDKKVISKMIQGGLFDSLCTSRIEHNLPNRYSILNEYYAHRRNTKVSGYDKDKLYNESSFTIDELFEFDLQTKGYSESFDLYKKTILSKFNKVDIDNVALIPKMKNTIYVVGFVKFAAVSGKDKKCYKFIIETHDRKEIECSFWKDNNFIEDITDDGFIFKVNVPHAILYKNQFERIAIDNFVEVHGILKEKKDGTRYISFEEVRDPFKTMLLLKDKPNPMPLEKHKEQEEDILRKEFKNRICPEKETKSKSTTKTSRDKPNINVKNMTDFNPTPNSINLDDLSEIDIERIWNS